MDKPHLALAYDERVPSDVLDTFCDDIEAVSLNFQKRELPSRGPSNSLEVVALPVVAFFILRPYFNAFMHEAGKHHYAVLRKALKRLWKHFFFKDRKYRVAVLTSSGELKQEYSPAFSIYAEINSGRKVKFLIREDCSKDEFADGIDAFLNLIESYYFSVHRDELDLDEEDDCSGHVLIEFDKESNSLRVLDPISHAKNNK